MGYCECLDFLLSPCIYQYFILLFYLLCVFLSCVFPMGYKLQTDEGRVCFITVALVSHSVIPIGTSIYLLSTQFSLEHTWGSLSDSLAASCCGGKLFSIFIIPGTFSCWNHITIYLVVIWLEITITMMAKALGKAPTFPSNLAQTISTQYRFVDAWMNERKLLNSCKGVLCAHVYKTVYGSVPELNAPQFDLLNKKGQPIKQGKGVLLKFSPKLPKVAEETWLCVSAQFLRSVIPVPALARRSMTHITSCLLEGSMVDSGESWDLRN